VVLGLQLRMTRFQWFIHLASWGPLAVLVWDYFQKNLTVNPIQAVEQRSGLIALSFLLFSLACTPLNTVFGFRPALQVRRALGLYAFFYATLHFLAFFAWDYGANLNFIWLDISDKRYILVGALALLILIVLALTSTRWSMRKLGKRWKILHQWVYPAAGLVVIHYVWSVKADVRLPIAAGGMLALLLLVRLPPLRRWLSQKRAAWGGRIRSIASSNPPAPEIK